MDCDRFSKLSMINDIRNYFNKLIRNTKNDTIKYFSNIELGSDLDNPHLHIQVWHDNQKQIDKIYEKVIDRFGLFIDYCKVSYPSTYKEVYNYVIKDYSKDLSDDEIMRLHDAKSAYRGILDKNIRFSSHSKGTYTKSVYKSLYCKYGIKKDNVDYLIDNSTIDIEGNIIDDRVIKMLFLLFLCVIKNKSKKIDCFECGLHEVRLTMLFEWWVYGKLWPFYLRI